MALVAFFIVMFLFACLFFKGLFTFIVRVIIILFPWIFVIGVIYVLAHFAIKYW